MIRPEAGGDRCHRSPGVFWRPLLGRLSTSAVRTLMALRSLVPNRSVPSQISDLSSPLPASGSILAAIDAGPKLSAFGAGLEIMVFAAVFTIGALLVVNWIIKTMRSSD
jgi:hypothetical protein